MVKLAFQVHFGILMVKLTPKMSDHWWSNSSFCHVFLIIKLTLQSRLFWWSRSLELTSHFVASSLDTPLIVVDAHLNGRLIHASWPLVHAFVCTGRWRWCWAARHMHRTTSAVAFAATCTTIRWFWSAAILFVVRVSTCRNTTSETHAQCARRNSRYACIWGAGPDVSSLHCLRVLSLSAFYVWKSCTCAKCIDILCDNRRYRFFPVRRCGFLFCVHAHIDAIFSTVSFSRWKQQVSLRVTCLFSCGLTATVLESILCMQLLRSDPCSGGSCNSKLYSLQAATIFGSILSRQLLRSDLFSRGSFSIRVHYLEKMLLQPVFTN